MPHFVPDFAIDHDDTILQARVKQIPGNFELELAILPPHEGQAVQIWLTVGEAEQLGHYILWAVRDMLGHPSKKENNDMPHVPQAKIHIECYMTNPKKPAGVGIIADGKIIAVADLDELRRAYNDLCELETRYNYSRARGS